MKMKKIVLGPIAVAAAGLLASCALMQEKPQPVTSIQFNYAIDNGASTGLVQAFDMDGNTVLQVAGLDVRQPKVFDAKGVQIKSKIVGQYVVLTGIHNQMLVQSGAEYSSITRKQAAPSHQAVAQAAPQPSAATPVATGYTVKTVTPTPAAQPSTEPVNFAAETQELARIRKELDELKALLTSLHGSQPERMQAGRKAGARAEPDTTVVRVRFKFNSAQFEPTGDEMRILKEYAPVAKQIEVTGYTDSAVQSQADSAIATKRADSARRYLTKLGVDERVISVSSQPAGGFIADNRTSDGRAKNRRVEIVMAVPSSAPLVKSSYANQRTPG